MIYDICLLTAIG